MSGEEAKQETYNPLMHVGLGIGLVCGNCFGPLTPACMWVILEHRTPRKDET